MSDYTQSQLPALDVPQGVSLKEFNERVKGLLYDSAVQNCWVEAETSDVHGSRGHCYLELVQKNEQGTTVARASAVIWASTFAHLNFRFREVTGQTLAAGMKVLVKVTANYHELYGLKLVITDINPQYTLGDMARLRMEILNRLTEEGLIDLNHSLDFTGVPQRIAVVSAENAAGYGDFMKQLQGNSHGLVFYTSLFPAVMQGTSTVPTVIEALNRIERHSAMFDCVAIIRGGGSTSDLNSFDNYDLAAAVARCTLPVITGIGHERDTTVLDYVAAKPVKTPTAAAQLLITIAGDALTRLADMQHEVQRIVQETLSRAGEQLSYYRSIVPMAAQSLLDTSRLRLEKYAASMPLLLDRKISAENARLDGLRDTVTYASRQAVDRQRTRLDALTELVNVLSPRNTLNRGYTLTMADGHIITDAAQLAPGTVITTHYKSGKSRSTVLET